MTIQARTSSHQRPTPGTQLFLLLGVASVTLLSASTAYAWDFTCSPRETKDLGQQTPNVMMMLDRSGSMVDDDDDDLAPRTCKVCQVEGELFEVASAADCVEISSWSSTQQTASYAGGSSGYSLFYDFPVPASHQNMDLAVDIQTFMDLNGNNESVRVFADGEYVGLLRGQDVRAQCTWSSTHTLYIPASANTDGNIRIELDSNDEVDQLAACNPSRANVTVRSIDVNYLATRTLLDPCGGDTKWEQAIRAIDTVTAQSDAASPNIANFGLGLFYNTTANIQVSCENGSNDTIVNALKNASPGSNTPTGRGIQVAKNSDCVQPDPFIRRTQTGDVGTDSSINGWTLDFTFKDVPAADTPLEVQVNGDFDSRCEFASVYVDGELLGTTGNRQCQPSAASSFTIPTRMLVDNEAEVKIVTRPTGEKTDDPACNASQDGVQAHCSGANGVAVTLVQLNTSPPPSATILINDGEPTRSTSSDRSSEADALFRACEHRQVAPMFSVGLGSGTDVDFNNILAAAGGSGSCDGDVDPCSYIRSDNTVRDFSELYGKCEGAIQADNSDDLLAALEAITAQLACQFNINFFNSGYTSVPDDPASEYPYLAVDVYNPTLGRNQAICHKDHPQIATASGLCITNPSDPACVCDDPQVGEGWDFTSQSNNFIQFSDYYCTNVRKYEYAEGSTQLACLCLEDLGADCSVPNWEENNVCPDGTWICKEGTDICEPEADCCDDGASCDTGLEGVCAAGQIVCDGSHPFGRCEQIEQPSEEVCDLLDNDCDGETDEDLGGEECTVPGETGRCAIGHVECIMGELECVPLGALPELCNGIDDDCDGAVDNMNTSWDKAAFSGIRADLTTDGEAAACNFMDVCMCPNGPAPVAFTDGFDEYLAAYTPHCLCGEGLAEANETPVGGSDATVEPAAACSTAGGSQGVMGLLIALGLLAVRRRP